MGMVQGASGMVCDSAAAAAATGRHDQRTLPAHSTARTSTAGWLARAVHVDLQGAQPGNCMRSQIGVGQRGTAWHSALHKDPLLLTVCM